MGRDGRGNKHGRVAFRIFIGRRFVLFDYRPTEWWSWTMGSHFGERLRTGGQLFIISVVMSVLCCLRCVVNSSLSVLWRQWPHCSDVNVLLSVLAYSISLHVKYKHVSCWSCLKAQTSTQRPPVSSKCMFSRGEINYSPSLTTVEFVLPCGEWGGQTPDGKCQCLSYSTS